MSYQAATGRCEALSIAFAGNFTLLSASATLKSLSCRKFLYFSSPSNTNDTSVCLHMLVSVYVCSSAKPTVQFASKPTLTPSNSRHPLVGLQVAPATSLLRVSKPVGGLGGGVQGELEATIATEWNPMRVGFRGQQEDLWVNDVLNIGVDPRHASPAP